MTRDIIILAAHDDGSGAHVSMCHIKRALVNAAQKKQRPIFILYLNSSSYDKPWAQNLWADSNAERWPCQESLSKKLSDDERRGKDGLWLKTHNVLELAKSDDGSLDVPNTRQMLLDRNVFFENWAHQIGHVPPGSVALAVDMGVPQLTGWAAKIGVPAITVGDMLWSRTLLRSLEGAGEYDEEMEEAIHRIADSERSAREVWLLPIVAPRVYADYLAEARIPALTLPGFFGPAHVEGGELPQRRSKKLVVLSAGQTRVWEEISVKLGTAVKECQDLNFALLHRVRGEWKIAESGQEPIPVQQLPSLLPYYAKADLGITRGGITITEFIAARIPFIIVQEPNHWLSQQQQAAAQSAGLCHASSLSRFQDPRSALEVISNRLESDENNKMRGRLGFYKFGIEDEWADYLLDNWARW